MRTALAERLARERLKRGEPLRLHETLDTIFQRLDALPDLDPRASDDIIGYGKTGLPL